MKRECVLTSLHLLRVTVVPAVGTVAAKVALRPLVWNGGLFWRCLRVEKLTGTRCRADVTRTEDRKAENGIGRREIEVGGRNQ